MADKKISELPVASAIGTTDISLLVSDNVDYQFDFTLLLQFISSNLATGATVTFGNSIPQDTTGKNGDVYLKTGTATFYQKISGAWALCYVIPTGSGPDGTMLYGEGIPGTITGADNDSYIDTSTGVFYLKTAGNWAQVFSMATGPQGPQGTNGTNGANGTNGNTILHGTANPSNITDGVDGDYYLNLSTYYFFGPKASGTWPDGFNIIGGAPTPFTLDFAKGSPNPVFIDWSGYSATYGNVPTVLTLVRNPTAISSFGTLNGGSGYDNGAWVINLTGGAGAGVIVSLAVSGGIVQSVQLIYGGRGYSVSDVLTGTFGTGGTGFTIAVQATGNNYSLAQFSPEYIMNPSNDTVSAFIINDPDSSNGTITADEIRLVLKQ